VNASIIGNRGDFWNNVKQSIYEAINEKRNAIQTAIKKKWIGKMKSMNMIMIILYVKYLKFKLLYTFLSNWDKIYLYIP